MKATQGNLRIDQSYKMLYCTYNGKYSEADLTAICYQCENCGKGIANIATVQGSTDGKIYNIGLDCAATLTGIEPSETAQAKKEMAREAKFRKWLLESMTYYVMEDGIALCYEDDIKPGDTTEHFSTTRYAWRCRTEKYAAALAKKPEYKFTVCGKVQPFESMPEYTRDLFLCEEVLPEPVYNMVAGDGAAQFTFDTPADTQLALL